jgi:integrase
MFAPVLTVQEYYAQIFLPVYVESALAKSTAASYRKNFRTHILPTLGTCALSDVTHNGMEDFVSDLVKKARHIRKKTTQEDGEVARPQPIDAKPEKPTTLAKATIDTVIKQLRKFFNHAKKRNPKLITDNPATGLTQLYSQARTAHEIVEPLTREEVPLFLAKVKEADNAFVTITRPDGTKYKRRVTQHYPLFFMSIHTGLRAGELAGLKRGDIDFHGKYVVVQRSIDRAHRKIVPTKSKRIRRVDLSDELIIVLKEHLRQQKEWWFAEGNPQPEWVFPNTEGEWSDMRNMQIGTLTNASKRPACIIVGSMIYGIRSLPYY